MLHFIHTVVWCTLFLCLVPMWGEKQSFLLSRTYFLETVSANTTMQTNICCQLHNWLFLVPLAIVFTGDSREDLGTCLIMCWGAYFFFFIKNSLFIIICFRRLILELPLNQPKSEKFLFTRAPAPWVSIVVTSAHFPTLADKIGHSMLVIILLSQSCHPLEYLQTVLPGLHLCVVTWRW